MTPDDRQTRDREIWRTLEGFRATQSFRDYPGLVRHLREQGEQLGVEDLFGLLARIEPDPYSSVPEAVARFLSLLVDDWQPRRILDPMGGLGLLGAWLAKHGLGSAVEVVTPRSEALEVTRPLRLANLALHVGGLTERADKLTGPYDLVASIPPINQPTEHRKYLVGGSEVELADDPALLALTDLAPRVGPQGRMAVVVSPRFGWEARPRSVRRNLGRFGLFLTALLQFRPGTFPGSAVAFRLAILEREPGEKLFVAEVPDGADAQAELVARLRKRRPGVTPSQGRLVPPDEFHSIAALEAKDRYEKLARDKGLESIPFTRAVLEIRTPWRRGAEFEHCDEDPAAVYLPQMAASRATTRQDELPPKLKSYLQLVVDPLVVLPDYLAGLLNTPMGLALRESCMTGDTIPRIRSARLVDAQLFLPPLESQQQGLRAASEIQRLRSELSELESTLWLRPTQAAQVLRAVRNVNHEERLADWLETLPFPLASILRSYHALDQSPKEKYERLLQFFEAFAEFCATLHISAVRTSRERWDVQLPDLARVFNQQHLSLRRASFGAWRAIAELMAARLRAMLANADDRAVACELYATADPSPLDVLASAEIAGLLQRVNSFRNRWTGHGGAVTSTEAAERHATLESDLARLRALLGTVFLRYELMEPREAEILDGPIFRCRIRRVMGSNPQLEHDTVDLTTPAKSGRLYVHNPGHDKALELLPLIQVSDMPQPASYFYNRLERAEPQLVTYQFAAQSEMSSTNATLLALLDEFARGEEAGSTKG